MQIFGKAAQFAEPVFSKGHLNDVKKKKRHHSKESAWWNSG